MSYPPNYAREDVLAAANNVQTSAENSAYTIANYSGINTANTAVQYARNIASSSLANIEAAAINAAIGGATAMVQAAIGSEVGAAAQIAGGVFQRAEAVAGRLNPALADAQEAAGIGAQEVAQNYINQANALATPIVTAPVLTPVIGRGSLCNPNSSVYRGAVETTPPNIEYPKIVANGLTQPQQKQRIDRAQVQFIIEIDGKAIGNNLQKYVEDVIVDETSDYSISSVKIIFDNDQFRFGNDEAWERGKTVNLGHGYKATGLAKRGNEFLSQGVKTIYPNAGGTPKIVLTAFGEEMRMTVSEERITWTNSRDSEIAGQIAKKYGWGIDADKTDPVYPHVAQVNESDWKFLDRRARYYGFQVFLQDKILHFHAPRYINSGISLVYNVGQNSQLNGFSAWETPLQHGKTVVASQIDPLAKEIFTVTSTTAEDDVTKKSKASFKGPMVTSRQMSSAFGPTPTLYMLEENHVQTNKSISTEIQGFSQYTQWLVCGSGSVVALENLKIRTCINLLGLGKDSGEYYIRKLVTTVKEGVSTSSFEVARTWRGGSTGSVAGPIAVEIPQAAS
jgi:phage protein D